MYFFGIGQNYIFNIIKILKILQNSQLIIIKLFLLLEVLFFKIFLMKILLKNGIINIFKL